MMDKKIVMFCLCALIAIFVIPSAIFAASFDCSKAKTKTEKAICDDPMLSVFDEVMAKVYSEALKTSGRDAIKKRQRKWLKEILAPCNGDKVCIKKAYENRLRQLDYDIESQKPVADDYSDHWVQSYARDARICKEAFELIGDDKSCRPFDAINCSEEETYSILIRGTRLLVFEEIASNEYGYNSVYRSIGSSLNGFAIIYVERYEGDYSPGLVETWKIDASDLDEVMKLPPGPITYKQRDKLFTFSHDSPWEINALEFSEMLKKGEKLTDEWSPVIDIFGEPYLIERECIGRWAFGGFYACEKVIKLTVKKLIKDKKTVPYCQFSNAKKKKKKATKEAKKAEQTKRPYEVMWAADAKLCEKVRSYADRERFNYMPTDVDFGNVKWIKLDDPGRKAINVTLAGESRIKTVFRWYTTRRMGLEWDFSLNVFPHEINFADLAKDPASFARKQEWTFEPDYVELTGLNGLKSPKPSPWCSKLDHFSEDLGCEGQYARWRFSFFDLIDIDGTIYITAATEKYQSPDDINFPVVILVGRYIAPKETPSIFGGIGNMKQLEHCCYLIKTP